MNSTKEFLDDIEKRLNGEVITSPAFKSPEMPKAYCAVASNEEIQRLLDIIQFMQEELDGLK